MTINADSLHYNWIITQAGRYRIVKRKSRAIKSLTSFTSDQAVLNELKRWPKRKVG